MLKIAVTTGACLLFAYGACGLIALWQFPAIARWRIYGRVLTGGLPATDGNKALLMLQSLFTGLFLVLVLEKQTLFVAMILIPYLMLCFAVMRAGRAARQV